jgi:hypothetical protein
MLGTIWSAPGEGDTPNKLLDAIENTPYSGATYFNMLKTEAREHLLILAFTNEPTNLRLTGNLLQEYDFQRLAVCE